MRHSDGLRAALAGLEGRDPHFKNTVLLLHGDGTNGAQNNTFVDSSTNNFTLTSNGTPTQGSFSPYGNNWSNYFDGSGDYLTAPAGSAFAYGTGDFTVEGWFMATAQLPQYGAMLFSQTISGNNYFICLLGDGTASNPPAKKIVFNDNGATNYISSTEFVLNTWNHFAIVRSSGSVTVYLNGVGGTAQTCTTNFTNTTYVPTIGRYTHTATNHLTGYLSNFRIVKGTAVYTSNFTPPTSPLTAITNTSLLTCQSNRFQDNSTNAFAITRNGDVSVQRFSPFAPSAAYSTSTIGGSGYFDGTGDTLTTGATTAFDFANNNFTIEAWIYTTSFATSQGICANQDNGGVSTLDGWVFGLGTDASISFQDWTNTTTVLNLTSSANVIRLNNWHHVVVEKRGTGTNQIQVFVDGVAVATGTRNANIPASTSNQPFTIGNWRYFSDSNREFTGYIADLRIVNSAVYNGTVTVPTAPLTAVTNTSLLCNFTNSGVFDSTMMNHLRTVANAQISTTQKKYGTGALYFDGATDYISVAARENFAFGTGDFTIEMWIYFSNTAGDSFYIIDGRNNSQSNVWAIIRASSGLLVFSTGVGATQFNGPTFTTTNTWTHIAYARQGTSLRLFVNGSLTNTFTDSTNYSVAPITSAIGSRFTEVEELNGYIDDLRITKGVARYTANFTPPTAALPDY